MAPARRSRSRSKSPSRRRNPSGSRKVGGRLRTPGAKRCLVTGASGFLGANLCKALQGDGGYTEIVAFGLPNSNTAHIDCHSKVRFESGDITCANDVRGALSNGGRGIDVVFNLCGDTSFWSRLYPRQRRINVEGVRILMEESCRQGVERVVHTSTVDAQGHDPAGGLVDEEWRDYSFKGWGYNYADTKREGEAVALGYDGRPTARQGRRLEVVVVRPGMMLGPMDFVPGFGRIFFDLREGIVPAAPAGGASWGHVTDVAEAHVRAADGRYGRAGESYICGGVNESYKYVFDAISRKVGVTPLRFTMPGWVLWVYGLVMELLANWITNRPPDMNPGMSRYMSTHARYDSSKACRELGYKVSSVARQVDDAYAWYVALGMLPAGSGDPRRHRHAWR